MTPVRSYKESHNQFSPDGESSQFSQSPSNSAPTTPMSTSSPHTGFLPSPTDSSPKRSLLDREHETDQGKRTHVTLPEISRHLLAEEIGRLESQIQRLKKEAAEKVSDQLPSRFSSTSNKVDEQPYWYLYIITLLLNLTSENKVSLYS